MQQLWDAACRRGEEADTANVPKKRGHEVFGGWVVKDGVSLHCGGDMLAYTQWQRHPAPLGQQPRE